MAEGFEPYHVPQQSRREKLRILAQNQHPNCVDSSPSSHNLQGCAGLLPFWDPLSFMSSDLLSCTTGYGHVFQPQNSQFLNPPVRQEGMNLMSILGSSSATQQNTLLESHGSLGITPTSVPDLSNNHQNSFLYASSQNVRQVDEASNFAEGRGEFMVYMPEALSLSLSSQQNRQTNNPLGLNSQRFVISNGGNMSRNAVSLGPYAGYSSTLKGSKLLKPAKQLLEEICDVSSRACAEKIAPYSKIFVIAGDCLGEADMGDSSANGSDDGEDSSFQSRLISMLDEVYRRYKQYHQQLEAVVESFESVAGLSNAAPFVYLGIKVMSKQFRRLKKAIIGQLKLLGKEPSHLSSRKDGMHLSECSSRPTFGSQRAIHSSGHHPVWRPQRGLPERAVSVLRSWLFDHFLHPYPTDTHKMMLAEQTGLTRSQVANWFINARVRLWKPMVEEIHALETRQGQKASHRRQDDDEADVLPNDPIACASSLTSSDNLSVAFTKPQDPPFKRLRNELPDVPTGSDQQMNLLPYGSLSGHNCLGGSTAGGSNGVSLTLGLHQNNELRLPESFPVNMTQRYAFNVNGEDSDMGAFGGKRGI